MNKVDIRLGLKAWGPVLLACVLLFFLSSISSFPQPIPPFAMEDKIAHLVVYAALALITYRALNLCPPRGINLSKPLLALLFTVVYGASDEFHQLFVHGRHCDFLDWLADALGAFGALYFFAGLQLYRRKNHANGS